MKQKIPKKGSKWEKYVEGSAVFPKWCVIEIRKIQERDNSTLVSYKRLSGVTPTTMPLDIFHNLYRPYCIANKKISEKYNI